MGLVYDSNKSLPISSKTPRVNLRQQIFLIQDKLTFPTFRGLKIQNQQLLLQNLKNSPMHPGQEL